MVIGEHLALVIVMYLEFILKNKSYLHLHTQLIYSLENTKEFPCLICVFITHHLNSHFFSITFVTDVSTGVTRKHIRYYGADILVALLSTLIKNDITIQSNGL